MVGLTKIEKKMMPGPLVVSHLSMAFASWSKTKKKLFCPVASHKAARLDFENDTASSQKTGPRGRKTTGDSIHRPIFNPYRQSKQLTKAMKSKQKEDESHRQKVVAVAVAAAAAGCRGFQLSLSMLLGGGTVMLEAIQYQYATVE